MTNDGISSESREVTEYLGPDVAADGMHSHAEPRPYPVCRILSHMAVKPTKYTLTIISISGKPMFWDGGYELKSQVTFKFSDVALKKTLRNVFSKYLPGKLIPAEGFGTDNANWIVNSRLAPFKYSDTLERVFAKSGETCTLYTRQVEGDEGCLAGSCAKPEDGAVRLKIVEVSERKILWDSDTESFQSSIELKFSRNDISMLRVEQVMATVLASNYYEPSGAYVEKKFWTDNVHVVSCKDGLDMLFSKKSAITLYLKLLRSVEELEWLEIIEAINGFSLRVAGADEELLNFYANQNVFTEMQTLKAKIQCDEKNEGEIEDLMKKLEPKLNEALRFLNEMRASKSRTESKEVEDTKIQEAMEVKKDCLDLKVSDVVTTSRASRTSVAVVGKSSCMSIMSAISGKFFGLNSNNGNGKDGVEDVAKRESQVNLERKQSVKSSIKLVAPKFYSW